MTKREVSEDLAGATGPDLEGVLRAYNPDKATAFARARYADGRLYIGALHGALAQALADAGPVDRRANARAVRTLDLAAFLDLYADTCVVLVTEEMIRKAREYDKKAVRAKERADERNALARKGPKATIPVVHEVAAHLKRMEMWIEAEAQVRLAPLAHAVTAHVTCGGVAVAVEAQVRLAPAQGGLDARRRKSRRALPPVAAEAPHAVILWRPGTGAQPLALRVSDAAYRAICERGHDDGVWLPHVANP